MSAQPRSAGLVLKVCWVATETIQRHLHLAGLATAIFESSALPASSSGMELLPFNSNDRRVGQYGLTCVSSLSKQQVPQSSTLGSQCDRRTSRPSIPDSVRDRHGEVTVTICGDHQRRPLSWWCVRAQLGSASLVSPAWCPTPTCTSLQCPAVVPQHRCAAHAVLAGLQ
jgi:hypothetical protein